MKILKKYKYYILSFLTPLLILLVYIFIRGIFNYNLIVADLREQYIFLFDYLKGVFNGTNSIFYHFGRGLGGTMYGTICYYLSSPLNILIIFSNSKNIHLFVIAIAFIKLSLAGLTMYIYLAKSNKNKEFINFILAISYSLMNYTISYFFQVMWLDVLYLAPLVLLGLDRILENKKSKSYILFLFISIISSYYISYMLCLFLVLYFIYRIFTKYDIKKNKEKIKNITKKFIISSILSGLLASFILIPVLYELSNTYRKGIIFNSSYIYNIFNPILKLSITRSFYSFYSNFAPHIFCGFIPLVIIINYLLKVKDKNKKYFIIMISFMFLSFVFPPLVKLWHGFEIPIYLFHRWAFLFSLFIIIIAGEKYKKIKEIDFNSILKITLFYFLLIGICFICRTKEDFDNTEGYIVFINALLLFITFIILNRFIKEDNTKNKLLLFTNKIVVIGCLLIVSFEANCTVQKGGRDALKEPNNYYDNRYDFSEQFTNLDKDYYRLGGTKLHTTNETFNIINGRNALFLSSVPKNLLNFYYHFGHSMSVNEYLDIDANITMNPLLGVKYWYGITNDENYKFVKNGNINIYKNDLALNIGYTIDYNKQKLIYSNPFEYQNSIFKSIYGKKIWKKYTLGDTYYNESSDLYFYADGYECDKDELVIFKLKDGSESDFCNEYGLVRLNVDEIEDIISQNVEADESKFYFYYFDNKDLVKMLKELGKEQINITKIEKNKLEFNITNKKKTLLLTIPYDKGWTIYVDGKKTDYYQIIDTFIGIDLKEGKHTIKMVYYPKYLKTGIIISSIDLICIFIYFNIDKFRKR